MADHHNTAGQPALDTPIESHRFDEKERTAEPEKPFQSTAKREAEAEESDDDENIDALIEDLESEDGHVEEEEEGKGFFRFPTWLPCLAIIYPKLVVTQPTNTIVHRHFSWQRPCYP